MIDELGLRCLKLISAQHIWIRRRVDRIQFLEDGQSRRSISFDFDLPNAKQITYQEIFNSGFDSANEPKEQNIGSKNQIVIPLAFMRKGALVNLDVESADGTPISVLGRNDNGTISFLALQYLARRIFKDNLQSICYAIKEVIYSSSVVFEDKRSKPMLVSVSDEVDKVRKGFLDDLTLFLESQTEKFPTIPSSADSGYCFNIIGFSIKRLLSGALEPDDSMSEDLRLFVAILSSIVDSYVFAVVVNKELVSHRSIIKVGFESQKTSFGRKEWNRPEFLLGAKNRVGLNFSTYGAASTHLEFNTTPAMEITALQMNKSLSGEEYEQEEYKPKSSKLKKVGNLTHLLVNSESRMPNLTVAATLSVRRERIYPLLVLSTVSAIVSGYILSLHFHRSDQFSKYFSADNTLALITIIFAIWAFTIFTGSKYRPELTWIASNLIMQVVSFATVVFALFSITINTDDNGDFLPSFDSLFVKILSFSLAGVSILVLIAAIYLTIRAPGGMGGYGKLPGFSRLLVEDVVNVQNSQDESETGIFSALSQMGYNQRNNSFLVFEKYYNLGNHGENS